MSCRELELNGARPGSVLIWRERITNGGGVEAICQRWRTFPCGKIACGIRISSRTERSLLPDLANVAARGASIHPRKQRSVSIRQVAIGGQFEPRALSCAA